MNGGDRSAPGTLPVGTAAPAGFQDQPSRHPDVLIVVMDCVRADDFPGSAPNGTLQKFMDDLRAESVVYSRCTTPSPWTLPAHASLLTGLYPWQHGVHAKGLTSLPATSSTIAESLRSLGYSSACFSANGFINPESGLLRGFDRTRSGRWGEVAVRLPLPLKPDRDTDDGPESQPRVSLVNVVGPRRTGFLLRFPGLLDAGLKLLHHLKRPGQPQTLAVSPWIEPNLRRWLRTVPSDRPSFCMINLLDAHEPYFSSSPTVASISDWLRYAGIPQDPLLLLGGTWKPTVDELGILHSLYVTQVALLWERIYNIISIYKELNRWDGCMLVLTSDHGQAFGEDGLLFHTLSLRGFLSNVPLWIRYPPGSAGNIDRGRTTQVDTSLVDVFPTLMQEVGRSHNLELSGRPLQGLGDSSPDKVILSFSEGIVIESVRARLGPEHRAQADHWLLSATRGNAKVILDVCHDAWKYVEIGPDGREMVVRAKGESQTTLQDYIRELAKSQSFVPSEGVSQRLSAWGYM